MPTFAEIVEQVEFLNKEELKEIRNVVEERWALINHHELVKAIEQSRKDRAEGKSVILSSPDEIKNWFSKNILSDEDLNEIELAVKKEKTERKINEILESARQARKESAEGKAYIASTPEEIIQWFKDAMKDEN